MPVRIDQGVHTNTSIPPGFDRLIAYQLREAKMPLQFDWLVKGIVRAHGGPHTPRFKVVKITPHGAVEVIVSAGGTDEVRSCKIIPPNSIPPQQLFDALKDSLASKPTPPVELNGRYQSRVDPANQRQTTSEKPMTTNEVSPPARPGTPAVMPSAPTATAPQVERKAPSLIGFLSKRANVELVLTALATVAGKHGGIKYLKARTVLEREIAPGASPKALGAVLRELSQKGYVEITGSEGRREVRLSANGCEIVGIEKAKPASTHPKNEVLATPAPPSPRESALPVMSIPKLEGVAAVGETIELVRTYIKACDEKLTAVDRKMSELSAQAAQARAAKAELESTLATLQRIVSCS